MFVFYIYICNIIVIGWSASEDNWYAEQRGGPEFLSFWSPKWDRNQLLIGHSI